MTDAAGWYFDGRESRLSDNELQNIRKAFDTKSGDMNTAYFTGQDVEIERVGGETFHKASVGVRERCAYPRRPTVAECHEQYVAGEIGERELERWLRVASDILP